MNILQQVKRNVYRNLAIVAAVHFVLFCIVMHADNTTNQLYFPHGHRAADSSGAWH